jgi:hypothetical protein
VTDFLMGAKGKAEAGGRGMVEPQAEDQGGGTGSWLSVFSCLVYSKTVLGGFTWPPGNTRIKAGVY